MANREQNERRFPHWKELPGGGRRYWFDVLGRKRGFARYVKIVDVDEMTVSFTQETYDENGMLIATHQKYPVDKGHEAVTSGDRE